MSPRKKRKLQPSARAFRFGKRQPGLFIAYLTTYI
jgi:hypothetical protein